MQKIEPAMFENLFEDRLEQYEEDRKVVSEEKESQSQLVVRIQEANAAFITARRGDSSTKEREQALQRLENAYFKYKEIVSNLNTGRKFYNDLATIVTRFTDECRDFAYHRRMEAGQMETLVALSLFYSTSGRKLTASGTSLPPSRTSILTFKTRRNGKVSAHTMLLSNNRRLRMQPSLRLRQPEHLSRNQGYGIQRRVSSLEAHRRNSRSRWTVTSTIQRTRTPMSREEDNGMSAAGCGSVECGSIDDIERSGAHIQMRPSYYHGD